MINSNLGKFAFDINDGNGFVIWPIQPKAIEPIIVSPESMKRIDGTAFLPKFITLNVTFEIALPVHIRWFQRMFRIARQRIQLNYTSALNFGLGATGDDLSGWIVSEDVKWTIPPFTTMVKSTGKGSISYSPVLFFENVESDAMFMG